MPTIKRKSLSILTESRREIFSAINWHVRSNVWNPPTDVYETDDSIVVKMEVAGCREEDLEVAVQENTLSISGSRTDSAERRAYHQMEIPFGRFAVTLELPAPVDVERASATYKDGFLEITLPRENPDPDEVE